MNLENDQDINEMENETPSAQEQPETGSVADNVSEAGENWEDKYKELYDNYLRLFSEFDNFRKRTLRERTELIKTAGSDTLLSMLPVLDDFERALKSIPAAPETENLKKGVELIYQKFKNTLVEKGLQEMEVLGEVFDPDRHEAVTHIPAPDADSRGRVLDVLEKGYIMNEKIIRYPKVVIGN